MSAIGGTGPAAANDVGPAVLVTVEDRQDGEPVDDDKWSSLAGRVLAALGVSGPGELSLAFVDADEMADLNQRHMGASGPTDVLSFPIDAELLLESTSAEVGAGVGELGGVVGRADAPDAPPVLLGDIVICPSVAAANASTHAGSADDELALLLVHGLLHLFGFDHGDPTDRADMQARERALLERTYGSLGRDPWTA